MSAIAGGCFLWAMSLASGGEFALLSGFLFYLVIPAMSVISAIVVVCVVNPIALALNALRILNAFSITLVGALPGLAVIFLQTDPSPLDDVFRRLLWGPLWTGGMALLFYLAAVAGTKTHTKLVRP